MSARPPKAKPIGRALDSSDDDLARAAEITEADFERALAEATPEMRALVEAEEHDGDGGTSTS
jgi:hypothetical protein